MEEWRKYIFKLETLTPLSISNGSKWFPFEYWKENEKLILANFEKLIDYIFSQSNWKEFYEKIIRIFSNENYYNNKRFELNFDVVLKELGLENKKKDFELVRAKYARELEDNLGEVKKEIIKFIREKDNLLIPGSSIKGTLRTALIYHTISNSDIIDVYRERDKKKALSHVNKKFGFGNEKNIFVRDTLINKNTQIHLIKRLGMGKRAKLNGIEVVEINDKDNIEIEIQVRRDIKKIIKEINEFSLFSINEILNIECIKKNQLTFFELNKIKNEIKKAIEDRSIMIFYRK